MHAAAEGLVLRVPAPAERVVLARRVLVARHVPVRGVAQGQAAGNAVGPVLGDLDGGRAGAVVVDVPARLVYVWLDSQELATRVLALARSVTG